MSATLGVAAFEYKRPISEVFPRVKALGVRHCELVTPGDITAATAGHVAELAAEHGITVTAVSSLTKLNSTDDVAGTQQVLNDTILSAACLGAPYVITYFGGHPERPVPAAIQRYKELIQPCLELAEQSNVTILIENHFSHAPGEATNTAEGCLELIQTIDSPRFQLNFDPCNYSIGAEEVFPYAYRLLRPHIRNVHMKDARKYNPQLHGPYHGRIVHDLRQGAFIFVPMGTGAVYNDVVLRELVADGYSGPVTIEAHTPEESLDEVFRAGIKFCRERGI